MRTVVDPTPLPLSDTLRDLAVLRAVDIDLAALLPSPTEASGNTGSTALAASSTSETDNKQHDVELSYEFVKEARAALRILNRGEVDKQGARVNDARGGLEEVLEGLEGR